MSEDKIYNNPTVKKVIFQITFPSLFSLENRMGEIQEKIMKEFPDSKMLLRSGFIVADIGANQMSLAVPKCTILAV